MTLRKREKGLLWVAVAIAVTLVLALLGPRSAKAATCSGKVVRVVDADTLWMMCQNDKVKIRFAQIDAPETGHPRWHKPPQQWGEKAKQALIRLVGHGPVTITYDSTDQYGRTIAEVYYHGTDVNLWLVKHGHAWAYTRYVTDPAIIQAQKQAEKASRGLWSLPEPTAPWEWRRNH